jgi:hypothetical protein
MLLALAFAIPQMASAQFTTFIPPRNPATTDSAKAAVAAQTKAETDSAINAQLANMKTWVDSAAGVTSPPRTAADSLAAQSNPQPSPQPVPADTATQAAGTRAPSTASNLPLMVLTGVGLLAIGTILVGGARPARQRA